MALDSNEQTTNYMGVAEPLHAVLIAETCTWGWKTSWSVTRTTTVPQFGLQGPKVYVKWDGNEYCTMFAGEQRCVALASRSFDSRLSGQPNTSQHLLHAFNFNVWCFCIFLCWAVRSLVASGERRAKDTAAVRCTGIFEVTSWIFYKWFRCSEKTTTNLVTKLSNLAGIPAICFQIWFLYLGYRRRLLSIQGDCSLYRGGLKV